MNDLVTLVVQFLVTGVSVLLVSALLPGMSVKRYGDAVGFAIVVAVLNVLVWKVFGLVTVPLAWLTLGLARFVLNGFIFLAAKKLVSGVEISGCLVASVAAFLVSLTNSIVLELLAGLLHGR